MARFQYMSDLHLESRNEVRDAGDPGGGAVLVLAGDIGNLTDEGQQYDAYVSFLERQTRNFERVFLVLGNHDFYGTAAVAEGGPSQSETARRLAGEARLAGRLTVLDRKRWDMDDQAGSPVTVLGCTLWTHIPTHVAAQVVRFVPDYRSIAGWTVETNNAAHAADAAWLRGQLADLRQREPHRRVLVVTHHAPLHAGTSHPQFDDSPFAPAFATNLLGDPGFAGASAWIFGHTHYVTSFEHGGAVAVMANPRGYPGENAVADEVDTDDEKLHAFDIKRVFTLA